MICMTIKSLHPVFFTNNYLQVSLKLTLSKIINYFFWGLSSENKIINYFFQGLTSDIMKKETEKIQNKLLVLVIHQIYPPMKMMMMQKCQNPMMRMMSCWLLDI